MKKSYHNLQWLLKPVLMRCRLFFTLMLLVIPLLLSAQDDGADIQGITTQQTSNNVQNVKNIVESQNIFTARELLTNGGSYSLKWYAADPEINKAPYLPTYAKVAPGVLGCASPSGGVGRASNPLADAVAYNAPPVSSNLDAVTSLAPKDMALCQIVPFFIEISVTGATTPENGVITINPEWLAKTTSGDNFGFDPAYGLYCAFVDVADAGTNDPDANAKVDAYTSTTVAIGTNNEKIAGTVQVSGLDDGDKIIVELWVVLKCTIPVGSTGNVQTSLAGAHTGPAGTTGDVINTGNQTVPLLRVQEFFSADADVSITKTANPVCIGNDISYTITVANNSTSTIANGVVVTDVLGDNLSYVSAAGATAVVSGQNITFNLGALTQLQTVTITIKATPSATGIVSNEASVTAVTSDPDNTNNNAQVSSNVYTKPTCSITGGAESITAGTSTNWCASAGMAAYLWTGPGGFSSTDQCVDVSAAGEYSVTITNDNGCTTTCTRTLVLTEACTLPPPTVSAQNNCDGTSVLTATNYTGTLLWSTGETTASITVNTAGNYTVTQTLGNCTSPAGTGTAAPKTKPATPVVIVTNNCNGTSILCTDAAGDLLWSNGETTACINVAAVATYTVTTTIDGCTSDEGSGDAAPKTAPDAPVINVTENCDGTATLCTDATGELLWSNGQTTSCITVSAAGEYSLTVTVNGCTSEPGTKTITTPKNKPEKPVITAQDNCDGTITLTTDAAGALLWKSSGETTASIIVNKAGSYTVTTTVNGCESEEGSITVGTPKQRPAKPVVTVIDNCDGTSTLCTDAAGNLLWSTGETTNCITVNQAGSYTVTATLSECTSLAGSGIAAPKSTPVVGAGSYGPVCANAVAITLAGSPAGGVWSGTGVTGTGPYSFSPATAGAGSHTLLYSYVSADGCANSATTTIVVNPVPPCSITNTTSPGATTASLGAAVSFSGPAGINYAYAWSFTANTSGASFAAGASTASGPTVTVTTATSGSYTLSLQVTDLANTSECKQTCNYTVSITPVGPYYTVTQGFYGNVGGKVTTPSCTTYIAGSKGNVDGLIAVSIKNMPGQQLKLGITPVTVTATSRTFIMGATPAEDRNLVTYLPSGQTPAIIAANTGINNNTNMSGNLPKLYNKKISSVLLGQTITLALNVYIPGNNLGGFVLKTGYLTTQKADYTKCPTIKLITCSTDATAISSLRLTTSTGLTAWINGGTKTVADLLNLASNALGGATLPAGITLADINNAVDVINRSFDGGRYFLGYYAAAKSCTNQPAPKPVFTQINAGEKLSKLSVAAYPNPFTDRVAFNIISPVSGKATLDIYSVTGQRLYTVYQGYLYAGVGQVINYTMPGELKGAVIYKLMVGNEIVNGKLMRLK